jgi:parvulin-like peptidyl-prolyl isomerase
MRAEQREHSAAKALASMRRQFQVFLFVPVALAALIAAACGGGSDTPQSVPSDAVAVVGDTTITKAEFDKLMSQGERGYKNQGRSWPKAGTPAFEQLKNLAVRTLVQQSEFEQKADDLGVSVTGEEIDNRIKQIKKDYFNNSEARYQKQLKAQGLTESDVRDTVENQLLSQEIYNDVTSDVKVGDDEVRKYYDSHRSQYETPESRDVRHILIACKGAKACDTAKAKADDLYRRLEGGANFAQLAKAYSDDPGSKAQGGKLTVAKGQTVQPFDQTAFLLGKGQISQPLKTQYGYHIIQPLSDVKPKKVTPFAQVKESIRQQLLQQKKQEVMNKWLKDTQKEFKIRYQVGYAPPQNASQ